MAVNHLEDHLGDHLEDHLVDRLGDRLEEHLEDHLEEDRPEGRQEEVRRGDLVGHNKRFRLSTTPIKVTCSILLRRLVSLRHNRD